MKNLYTALFIPVLALTSYAEPLKIEAKVKTQVSHGLGYIQGRKLAQELMNAGFEQDDFAIDDITKGFTEALNGKDSTTQNEDFNVSMEVVKAMLLQREQSISKANEAKIEPWLKEVDKDKDVKSTPSGLRYKVVTAGEGKTVKDLSEEIKAENLRFIINYEGALTDGTVFEKMPEDKATALDLNGLPGVVEALKLMPIGSTWKLYLKPSLAYGQARPNAKVSPNSCVVFTVKLVDIKDATKLGQ